MTQILEELSNTETPAAWRQIVLEIAWHVCHNWNKMVEQAMDKG